MIKNDLPCHLFTQHKPVPKMPTMIVRIMFFLILIASCTSLLGQGEISKESRDSIQKTRLRFAGDSRITFINKNSVSIYGIRLGLLFKDKIEVGLGVYSTNLLGLLGSSVSKEYIDDSRNPATSFNSEIGFHYFSIFGEYRLLNTNRLVLTFNTQLGLGSAVIEFTETNEDENTVRRTKILIEHSLKVDVKTFDWLRLAAGGGYRYLLDNDQQLKDAFNSPIVIIGFTIDYGLLKRKLFNKKSSKKNF